MDDDRNLTDALTTKNHDGRPYLSVKILGKSLVGLLDSGSTRSLVGREGYACLESLGLPLRRYGPEFIRVANGMKAKVLGTINAPIEAEEKITVVDLLIVPELDTALILGVDFWRQSGIVPNLREGTLSFPICGLMEEDAPIVTAVQRKKLEALLDASRNSTPTIGCTNLVSHKIETGDAAPIKQRYYPVSPYVQALMTSELEKMLKEDVVEPSKSGWSSPVVLVKRADGSVRFCVDYRKLNRVTLKDAYPIPYVSTILDRLRNARYLSALDIKSAYWQVPVDEGSREKTAFVVPNRGLFQFKRMPFGLTNAPATWQRLVDAVLGADLEPHVFVYLDDIVVVTQTFEKHYEVLSEVLRRLSGAGLTLGWDKCRLGAEKLKYLGYLVTPRGLHVDPEKVSAVVDYPVPKTPKNIRQFLGLVSWYRRFIPDFASVAAPLTKLTRKGQEWLWGAEQDGAFRELKGRLVKAPILSCPDFGRPFLLQTDASTTGVGAILSQVFEDGERPIAYASRALTSAERKYTTTEQECLAVVFGTEKFRCYLEGARFEVITDHHSLQWLHNLKDPQGRLARWAMKLQAHDFTITHRPGRLHQAPDALSRATEVAAIGDWDELDSWYLKLQASIKKDPAKYPDWRTEGGKLLKFVRDSSGRTLSENHGWKWAVPKSGRREVIERFHDNELGGHLGGFKTLRRIQDQYYWPGMSADVGRYVSRCETCLAQKPLQRAEHGLMGKQRKATQPWQLACIDIMGPFPRSRKGYKYLLVIVDTFSKFPLLFPLRSATAAEVTRNLEEGVFLMFGAPKTLISDNGTQFCSREYCKLLEEYGVTPWRTPLYHPQSNPTERVNRVIKTVIRSYLRGDHKDWDRNLSKVGYALRTAVNEVTGFTPAYLNFGRELHHPPLEEEQEDQNQTPEYYGKKLDEMQRIRMQVVERLRKAYDRNVHSYNLRRREAPSFEAGDEVWRKTHHLSDAARGFAAGLAPKYEKGIVRRKITSNTYELEDLNGRTVGIYHVGELKSVPTC